MPGLTLQTVRDLSHPIRAAVVVPAERGYDSTLYFENPHQVWHTFDADQAESAFALVESERRAGRCVVGLIRYEAGRAFDPAIANQPSPHLPLLWFASFDGPAALPARDSEGSVGGVWPSIDQQSYDACVRAALEHIRLGNIYQVNYTIRAGVDLDGDPFALWRALLDAVPVPHAAFVDCGDVQILSLSPELFLKKTGSLLETKPMKGTAARKPSWNEDEAARVALEASEKDRAENTMIVDLMRNDLSRICVAGTVHVPELCKAYRFPTVHQMTSTVRGQLRAGVSLFDIFRATFPPGSVTGAPKVRATQIIRDLEPTPRGIYCGSIGLFYPNGDFTCNVAIRTLESSSPLFDRGQQSSSPRSMGGQRGVSSFHPSSFILHPLSLGLGSGIVIDSNPESEWRETLVKSRFVHEKPQQFDLFETFRFVPGLGYRNLHNHLRRLKNSCIYFSRPFPLHKILHTLRDLKPTLGNRPHRVRLELSRDEAIAIRLIDEQLNWPAEGITLMISASRLDPDDPRLYHKTTARQEKSDDLSAAQSKGAHEVLYLNTRGELCEGAISNILLLIDGEWLTPALTCGLLPGVWRAHQLKSGRAREAVLTLDDLRRADQILMGNSVRGETPVTNILDLP